MTDFYYDIQIWSVTLTVIITITENRPFTFNGSPCLTMAALFFIPFSLRYRLVQCFKPSGLSWELILGLSHQTCRDVETHSKTQTVWVLVEFQVLGWVLYLIAFTLSKISIGPKLLLLFVSLWRIIYTLLREIDRTQTNSGTTQVNLSKWVSGLGLLLHPFETIVEPPLSSVEE